MTFKAGIFILTQNTNERKIYLKTSLYFLFRHFNKKYKYPIIIMHEGDYDTISQNEIKLSIREECRNLISFKQLNKEDFEVPSHIDKERVQKIIDLQPVPYWRNLKYRLMCNFWMNKFSKYTEDYDYVMRIDDDSIIEETINNDLFKIMHDKELVYMSNIIHVDCGICNYGMKDLFKEIFPDKLELINGGLFIDNKMIKNTTHFNKFNEVYKINENKELVDDITINMPIMYYNNFFITSTKFWKKEEVLNVLNKIDENGGIFYYRYGDAPLQTLIVSLIEPSKISRSIFKYSKRLQRECFIDTDNNIHSYMPKDYDKSSCITEK